MREDTWLWLNQRIQNLKKGKFTKDNDLRYGHYKSVQTSNVITYSSEKVKDHLKKTFEKVKVVEVGEITFDPSDIPFEIAWTKYLYTLTPFTKYPLHFAHACMWALSMGMNKTTPGQEKILSVNITVDEEEKMISIPVQAQLFLRPKIGNKAVSLNKIYLGYIDSGLFKKADFSKNADIYKTMGRLRHEYRSDTVTATQAVYMVKYHYEGKKS